MNNKIKKIGKGYGRLKSENKTLKEKIEKLEFENRLLKNHNEQLFKQLNE